LYLAEAPPDAPITLDHESDRYEWLSVAAALERCRPAAVAEDIALALTHLR
jgi:hypothetical protein